MAARKAAFLPAEWVDTLARERMMHQRGTRVLPQAGGGGELCLASNRPRLPSVLLSCPVAWSDLNPEPRSTGPGLQATQSVKQGRRKL